jgi:hypothetical protein
MRPISELTFEHGQVVLRCAWNPSLVAAGSLLINGMVSINASNAYYHTYMFTHFVPVSEIAQLQEAGK